MATEAWLRLLAADEPDPRVWRPLLEAFGEVEAVVSLPRSRLEDAGVDAATVGRLETPNDGRIERWRRWLDDPHHRLVTIDEPVYPRYLAEIADAPLALWVDGSNVETLSYPQLAIVGSRNPTRGGSETAETFARYFSDRGLVITSGLAQGIDTASHIGAAKGTAGTIAVLGNGPDRIYPRSNAELAARIVEHGLVISEFPPGTPPRPYHFPKRNRIIAGLTLGTLVIEAARRSGSLITARYASEFGREVFAVPGSIHNPLTKGCHALIRDGAKLVDDAVDVLLEIAPQLAKVTQSSSDPTESEHGVGSLTEQHPYTELLDALGFEPSGIASLAERVGLTTAEVSSMLLILEFEGLVEALPGGRYARLSQRDQ
jgi:DNA processing protein